MATTLAELALHITSKDDATATVNSMGAKIKAELNSISTFAKGIVFGNLATNLTMGVAERVKTAAESFDQLSKSVATVKRLTGESAEPASMLLGTLTRYGMTSDQASTALVKLARSMAQTEDAQDIIAAGGKSGAAQLAALGIQSQDAAGKMRSSTDVILAIADAIKNKSAAEQISIISTIFKVRGGEAADLQRVLSQGSTAIQAYFGVLRTSGNFITDEQLADFGKFSEANRQLDLALRGVAVQLGGAFAPALTSAAKTVSDLTVAMTGGLVPLIKDIPGWIVPAALDIFGLGIALNLAGAAAKFAFAPFVAAAGAIVGEGAVAGPAAIEVTGLATAETAATIAADRGAVQLAMFSDAEVGVGTAAAGASAKVGFLGKVAGLLGAGFTAFLGTAVGGLAVLGAGIYAAMSPMLQSLQAIHDFRTELEKIPADKFNPIQKAMFDILKSLPDIDPSKWGSSIADTITPKTDAAVAAAEAKPEPPPGPTETQAEKTAKAAKAAADRQLKGVQDAAAERKAAFDAAEADDENHQNRTRAALEAKLSEAQANQALVPMKRQLEDLDRASLDYAHQRLVINQDELATQARIGEEKLKNAADDLSYQEKLLLAQARAAKMRGENVDMDALRQKVMAIRTAQIEGEPGLLIAGHNTALADRAKNATSLTDQVAKDELEKRKIAIQEANQPLQDELTLRKRMTEDAQNLLELDKMRFEITETFYAKDLLLAQIAAKAADEAYQKAVAAATAAGVAPGTPPLANGVGGSPIDAREHGTAVNITNNNTVRNDADIQAIADKTTDQVLGAMQAAQRGIVRPARTDQPGAFAAATA